MIKFFKEHYQCQTLWIQIRTNILLVLIWVQTVCKGYQQMTKGATSKERVNGQDMSSLFQSYRVVSQRYREGKEK